MVFLALSQHFFIFNLKSDHLKIAIYSERGNFQPTRLPFGGHNSTNYFHILISKCLGDVKWKKLQYFLNDIIIAADIFDELISVLQVVSDWFTNFNLTLDPAKLQPSKSETAYLGFTLNENGYSSFQKNIDKVLKFLVPINVKEENVLYGEIF